MATSKKAKTKKSKAAVAVPIPGTLSIQGPLPVSGTVDRAPQRWEHLVVNIPANSSIQNIQNIISPLGTQGWELVCPLFGTGAPNVSPIVFKRPA